MSDLKIKDIIQNLEIIKAQVEWEYPLDYQATFDSAINGLKKLEKIDNELKMFSLVDDTETNFRQFHKHVEQILKETN